MRADKQFSTSPRFWTLPGATALLDAIPKESHGKQYPGNFLQHCKAKTRDFILGLVKGIVNAPPELWPRRVGTEGQVGGTHSRPQWESQS